MKRTILAAAILLLIAGTLYAAFTTSAENFAWNSTRLFQRNGQFDLWSSEVEGYLSGTDAAPGVYADTVRLTVSDALQAHTKGLMWYSDANEAIEYWNGSAIVTMTSGRKVVENNSEPPTIGVAESGYVITNAGSDGADAFTLPDAAAGLTYTFVVMAAQELRVTPAAGDKIVYGSTVMDAAEYYVADAIGESLTIVAVDATNWVVISSTGTWTEEIP